MKCIWAPLLILVWTLLSVPQTSFDSARVHNHVTTLTFEGVWVKRMVVPSQTSWPLGNQLAVKGASNELWFYYGFDPLRDGPTIAEAESTPSGMRTRVTYDPVCFYVTKLELLGPVLPIIPRPTPNPIPSATPSPTPISTPSPTPSLSVRENLDIVWPSSEAARTALWRDRITFEGWGNCSIYNNRIRCWRPR